MRISDWSSDVCSSDLLASPRPLTVPYADYDEETAGALEIFRAAATAHALYGQGAITVALISKAASVSDLLELLVLLKEAGLYLPGHEPAATIMPVPLFATIDALTAAPPVIAAVSDGLFVGPLFV